MPVSIFLDLRRSVAVHFDSAQLGREYDHTAGMAHQDGRRRPFVVRIELLKSHYRRLEFGDDIAHAFVNFLQLCGETSFRLATDDTRFD